MANFYFLLIAILQQIPDVSPTGQWTTIVPLALFVGLAMLREGLDDLKRHKQDDLENLLQQVLVWRKQKVDEENSNEYDWQWIIWKDVQVGDIVMIKQDEFFPADVLCLASTEDEGECYVETSSLDGESNLKQKLAVEDTQSFLLGSEQGFSETIGQLRALVKAQNPNNELYAFDGSLQSVKENQEFLVPIGIQNLLLRGSRLKKTQAIYGLVVYTGEETKIRKNLVGSVRSKVSVMESRMTNRFILVVFVLVIALTVLSFLIFRSRSVSYSDASGNTVIQFFTFLVLYNTMIPISLYVSLEIVKLFQAFFIDSDLLMYDASTDTPAKARTSSLNEDLGQIQYLFSDKTGTLTENQMILKYFTAQGTLVQCQDEKDVIEGSIPLSVVISGMNKRKNDFPMICDLLQAMTLSHTALPCYKGGDAPAFSVESKPNSIPLVKLLSGLEHVHYQAMSPDEEALLEGAKKCQFIYFQKTSKDIHVIEMDSPQTYRLLDVLEFSSARKRASCIYQTPKGKIMLFCKGADNVMLPRVTRGDPMQNVTIDHVTQMAEKGYRTLLYARKELSATDYHNWKQLYSEACLQINDRVQAIENCCELLETDMQLLGGTGIEDKLQANVPETIECLRKAGIKVWVLTGDKRETVVNIGRASKIIRHNTDVYHLDSDSVDVCLNDIWKIIKEKKKNHSVLVIGGHEIHLAEKSEILLDKLLLVASRMDTVICCRISPIQKSLMVKIVRDRLQDLLHEESMGQNPWPDEVQTASPVWLKVMRKLWRRPVVTCAIGDGANDIAMIEEAHVGIGITGKEGLQAARASDYAIAQFQYLTRILLVHGHFSYMRSSNFLLNTFYKNVMFYFTQFFFQLFCDFSGTSMFERWTLSLYNVIFSSLTVISIGIFDRPVKEESTIINEPWIYLKGSSFGVYNSAMFGVYCFNALVHAALITFGVYLSIGESTPLYSAGTIVYSCAILVINLKFAYFESSYWAWPTVCLCWFTILFWYIAFQPVYSLFFAAVRMGPEVYGIYTPLFGDPVTHLVTFLVVVVTLVPECIIMGLKILSSRIRVSVGAN